MKDFKRFLNKLESVVLGLSIIGVIFLVMQLGFIKNIEMPTFYDDYEYSEMNSLKKNNEVGYIILKKKCDEIRKISIMVNGKGNYKFDKNDELMLKISDDDIIEIDNTVNNGGIELKVVGISKNVKEPKLNEMLKTKEGIKILFKVKIN